MNNPFLEGGVKTHEYKGQIFIVDHYPEYGFWQCSDGRHWVRGRAKTMQEAIDEAHNAWDEYMIEIEQNKNGGNK